MSDKRIGRQFPTQHVVLEYKDTKGEEAILLGISRKGKAD